jgi:hypothetical protein
MCPGESADFCKIAFEGVELMGGTKRKYFGLIPVLLLYIKHHKKVKRKSTELFDFYFLLALEILVLPRYFRKP